MKFRNLSAVERSMLRAALSDQFNVMVSRSDEYTDEEYEANCRLRDYANEETD